MSMTTELKVTCPDCGQISDRATDLSGEDAVPEDGDLTVCTGCMGVFEFDSYLPNGIKPASAIDEAGVKGTQLYREAFKVWGEEAKASARKNNDRLN